MASTRDSGTAARGPAVFGCAVMGTVAVLLCALIATIVTRIAGSSNQPAVILPPEGCRVSLDSGFATTITWEQADNVAIIVGESIRRGLPARAATIAVVTAYQESDLRNLDYGDLDSVGLFQQRPSQGWGTVEQIMDPWYSSGAFYAALVQVPGWDTGVINDVAQTVQRSAYPEAYAQHEDKGRAWASSLHGYDPMAISCFDAADRVANATVITDFVDTVWGGAVTWEVNPTGEVRLSAVDEQTAWSVAQLSMLLGRQAGVVQVAVGDAVWAASDTEYAAWTTIEPPTDASVIVTLAS